MIGSHIWETIVSSDRCGLDLAPIAIRSDQDLMMKACSKKCSLLENVDESLALDNAFLHEVIAIDAMALCYLSHEAQRRFPDLLTDNLRLKAWFTSGGLYEPRCFPDSRRGNQQIFLWIAEHAYSSEGCFNSFEHVAHHLKDDIAFMEKAIEFRPNLFFHASNGVSRYENALLLVKALAASISFAYDYVKFTRAGEDWRQEFFTIFLT